MMFHELHPTKLIQMWQYISYSEYIQANIARKKDANIHHCSQQTFHIHWNWPPLILIPPITTVVPKRMPKTSCLADGYGIFPTKSLWIAAKHVCGFRKTKTHSLVQHGSIIPIFSWTFPLSHLSSRLAPRPYAGWSRRPCGLHPKECRITSPPIGQFVGHV